MTRLKTFNYYDLLEVPCDATPFEIHHAYKEMMQLYHDDSLATYSFFSKKEREEILGKMEEAYSALVDEKKRSDYDQLLIKRGMLQKENMYQKDRKRLTLLSHTTPSKTHMELRIRDRLKTIAASNPIVQEMLTREVLTGNDLKKIRNELGVSLEEIANMVKIRKVYLQAIEEDRFDQVPSRVFLKGFLKSYAQCLGLDADRIANCYLKRIDLPGKTDKNEEMSYGK